MSYHGFGQSAYPQPITEGLDPVAQPTSSIAPMSMININPMIPPGEYATGEQALMLEMQSRQSGDMSAGQPASFGVTMTEQQIYDRLVLFWQAVLGGKTPPDQGIMDYAMKIGRGDLVSQAETYVMSGGKAGGFVPATIAPTAQPARNVTSSVNILPPPNPAAPVTNTMVPAANITTYVPETGLNPAQPETQIPEPSPPAPTNYEASVGPITGQAPAPYGPIPEGSPSVGPIPEGSPSVGPIPQPAPQIPQYVASPTPMPLTPPAQSSSLLPLIAIGVGAFILAKLL